MFFFSCNPKFLSRFQCSVRVVERFWMLVQFGQPHARSSSSCW